MAALRSGSLRMSAGIWFAMRGGRRGVAESCVSAVRLAGEWTARYLSEAHGSPPPQRPILLLVVWLVLPRSFDLQISFSDFVARGMRRVRFPVQIASYLPPSLTSSQFPIRISV
jgi:hypothetical protein